MGIYRHPKSGIWHANYFDAFNKRHRPSLHTKDKRVAEIKFADIRRAQALIKYDDHVNITWTDFQIKYEAFLNVERRPGTAAHFKLANKYLTTFLKPRFLAEITPERLQELKQYLVNQNKGPAGINKYIRCIKAMMRQAERWRLVPRQEWTEVKKLKEKKGRLEFYTEDEVSKLLSSTTGDWKLVILLGTRAGLRRGEIIALQWTDIDFRNNQIYVAPQKTDNYRYVPMAEDLRAALAAHPKKQKSPYIINLGLNNGEKRTTKDYLSSFYPEVRKKAGLGKKGSMHTLRHTFASHLVQAGVDLYSVSKLLGHTSIKTTEIYAHLAPKTLQDAITKLPKIK